MAFEQLKAHITFLNKIARTPLVLDDVEIDAIPLNHPQGCLGFRFREEGHTLVFLTDNELGLDGGYRFQEFVKFARGADLLIHDAQYLPEEMPAHRGWGHSTFAEAVNLALEAEVKNLLLTHHDPARTDAQVREIVRRARRLTGTSGALLNIDAAREGEKFSLPVREREAAGSPQTAAFRKP